MKLSIGRKLGLGYALIVLLLIVSAANSVASINRANDIVSELIAHTEQANAAHDAETAVSEAFAWTVGYTLLGESEGQQRVEQELAMAGERYEDLSQSTAGDTPAALSQIEEVGLVIEGVEGRLDTLLTQYDRNPDNAAAVVEDLIAVHHYLINDVAPAEMELEANFLAEFERLSQEANDKAAAATRVSVILGLLASVLSITASWVISRGITRSAQHISSAADRISRGDLDAPIEVTSGDEMQSLAEAVDRMRNNLRDAIRRLL